jgi:gamma-glutamylcyclotransferase (GGCT)/AIG2-like uncharacterized protein YtfP
LPGEPNHQLLDGAVVALEPACLWRARLFDMGYFPMLVDAPAGEARGLLIRLKPTRYARMLALLDQVEGVGEATWGRPLFRRERRVVTTAGGDGVVAWTYVGWPPYVAGLEPIPLDWKSYVRGVVKSS